MSFYCQKCPGTDADIPVHPFLCKHKVIVKEFFVFPVLHSHLFSPLYGQTNNPSQNRPINIVRYLHSLQMKLSHGLDRCPVHPLVPGKICIKIARVTGKAWTGRVFTNAWFLFSKPAHWSLPWVACNFIRSSYTILNSLPRSTHLMHPALDLKKLGKSCLIVNMNPGLCVLLMLHKKENMHTLAAWRFHHQQLEEHF